MDDVDCLELDVYDCDFDQAPIDENRVCSKPLALLPDVPQYPDNCLDSQLAPKGNGDDRLRDIRNTVQRSQSQSRAQQSEFGPRRQSRLEQPASKINRGCKRPAPALEIVNWTTAIGPVRLFILHAPVNSNEAVK